MLTARFLESRKRGDALVLTSPSPSNTRIAALQAFLCSKMRSGATFGSDEEYPNMLWPWRTLDVQESSHPILLQGLCMNWDGGGYAAINTETLISFEVSCIILHGKTPMYEVDGITASGDHYEFVARIDNNELVISGFNEIGPDQRERIAV